jgi:hypothetical protein
MEASPKPHLRVVDGITGEVHEDVCEECLAKDRRFSRLQRSYEGTIQRLRAELDEKRDQDKQYDPLVVRVVEDWCRKAQASGVWKSLPKVTDPRVDATRTAMNKGHDAAYLLNVNTGAFIAVSTDRQIKPQWLEPTAIYGRFIDAHFQTALSPSNQKLRRLLEAPAALLDRWMAIEPMVDPCDHCGHLRLDHDKPSIANDFSDAGACLVHGCADCPGFDDFDLKGQRWLEARAPKPRFRS